jgi:hypothetical protein
MKRRVLCSIILLTVVAMMVSACDAGPGSLGAEPTPTVPEGAGRTVTLADDGQTISMQVGESFLLKLGEAYEWTVIPLDPDIIRRVPNVLTVIGSQGLYQAHKVGRTQLTATGEPPCRQAQPPCAMPSRGFLLNVVVQ